MAVFIDYKKKIVVFTSYKVGYSSLLAQRDNGLIYLNYKVDWNIFKHLIKHYNFKRYCIVRHPLSRFSSLFNDKFRKQPQRILQQQHKWENVHKCLYSFLKISSKDSDETIAMKFLEMEPSDLLKILPEVIELDEHFMPQTSSFTYNLLNALPMRLRINQFFRLEDDLEELSKVTGLDFTMVKNISNSSKTKQGLDDNDIAVINHIYANDFSLGNYTK